MAGLQTANLPLVDFTTYPFVVLSSDDISFLSVLALKMSLKNTLNAFCIAFGILFVLSAKGFIMIFMPLSLIDMSTSLSVITGSPS